MKKLAALFMVYALLFISCGSEESQQTADVAQVQGHSFVLADNGRLTDRGETIIDFEMSFYCEDSENHKGTVCGEVYISSRQEDFKIVDVRITQVPWAGHPWQFQGSAWQNITHNGNRAMISVSGIFEKENIETESIKTDNLPGRFLKMFDITRDTPRFERVNMLEYSAYIYRADIWRVMPESRGEV